MITTEPSGLPTPTSMVALLSLAVVALAGTVVFLFKYYSGRMTAVDEERRKRDDEQAKERQTALSDQAKERTAWALERVELRTDFDKKIRELQAEADRRMRESHTEYERKLREAVEKHAATISELYEAARENEISARREYTANMEVVATKAAEANDKIGAVLEKMYDRYVPSRRT